MSASPVPTAVAPGAPPAERLPVSLPELAGYEPIIVHVDTANRQVDSVTAELLATEHRGPAPHRYVEVPAN